MTVREALFEVARSYDYLRNPKFKEAVNCLYHYYDKDSYKWHDLKGDPNDLPEEDEGTIVATDFSGNELYMICDYRGGKFRDGINPPDSYQKNIVAWRYIERFKGEQCS